MNRLEIKCANFLGNRIKLGLLDYKVAVTKRPDLKELIDAFLVREGYDNLIVNVDKEKEPETKEEEHDEKVETKEDEKKEEITETKEYVDNTEKEETKIIE